MKTENDKLLNDYIIANKLLNIAMDNLFSGILMFEDSKLILMNKEAERIINNKVDKIEDFLDRDLLVSIKNQFPPVKMVTQLINSLPVELTYIEIKDEKLIQFFIINDLTEKMKLKNQYKNLKETYASLINSAGIGICLINVKGKILFVNKKFSEILKIDYKEAVGKRLLDFLCLSKKCMNNLLPVLNNIFNGKQKEAIVEIESKNTIGEKIFLECTITLYKEGDFVVGFQFIINDITKKKELESENIRLHDEFMELEKDRVAIEFAGATAHELNQPLTALMLASDMIKIKKKMDDNLIYKIGSATERLAKIVKKLSKITKYETKGYIGKSKIVNLNIENE
jgi:PAS domain S-box-containing protein